MNHSTISVVPPSFSPVDVFSAPRWYRAGEFPEASSARGEVLRSHAGARCRHAGGEGGPRFVFGERWLSGENWEVCWIHVDSPSF